MLSMVFVDVSWESRGTTQCQLSRNSRQLGSVSNPGVLGHTWICMEKKGDQWINTMIFVASSWCKEGPTSYKCIDGAKKDS